MSGLSPEFSLDVRFLLEFSLDVRVVTRVLT